MSTPASDSALRSYYREESDRVRRDYEANGSGRTCIQERSLVVDKLLHQLWAQQATLHANPGYALVALGGYGRRALYPQSDIDLLFLCETEALRDKAMSDIPIVCPTQLIDRVLTARLNQIPAVFAVGRV